MINILTYGKGRVCGLIASFGLILAILSPMAAKAGDEPAAWDKTDPTSIEVQFESVPLNFNDQKKTHVGRLTYMGGLELKSPDKRFGGLSGIRLSPDGKYMLTLSDNGFWFSANLTYTAGRLTGIKNGVMAPILDGSGQFVAHKGKSYGDAEAFTEIPGGGIVVSFEGGNRVEGGNRLWYYPSSIYDIVNKKQPRPLPLPVDLVTDIRDQPPNGGIEALTTLADGSLLAFSEERKDENGNLKGWIIGSDGSVELLAYKPSADLAPSDMATLPNGDALVLERKLSIIGGWTARLRLIKQAELHSGKPIVGEEVAKLEFPYNLDNMEGLAVRQDNAGHTYIYMISDDNYFKLERTILLMFRLDKKPLGDDVVDEANLKCPMCRMVIDAMGISDKDNAAAAPHAP